MASATLEREVEVIVPKSTPVEVKAEPIVDAAKAESRGKVEGSGSTGEARAWNSRAQID